MNLVKDQSNRFFVFPIWGGGSSKCEESEVGPFDFKKLVAQPEDDLQKKPAEKPKPRSRYSKAWVNSLIHRYSNQDMYNINTQNNLNLNTGDTDVPNIYELPPQVNIEGDK